MRIRQEFVEQVVFSFADKGAKQGERREHVRDREALCPDDIEKRFLEFRIVGL